MRQTQIDILLQHIIKQKSTRHFLEIIKYVEPRLAKWLTFKEHIDQIAPTLQKKEGKGILSEIFMKWG